MSRRLVILIPCMGLQVATRGEPALRQRPLALVGEPTAQPWAADSRVVECSRLAAEAGVSEGQTLTRAKAACPDLVTISITEDETSGARREVLEALILVVPRVEWIGGGAFHADVTGMARLVGSERRLLFTACEAVQRLGLVGRAACSSTRFVSSLVARTRSGVTIVAPGRERAFVDALPLSLLPLSRDVASRLDLLGIRSLGQLAELPAGGLADRFGAEALRWQRLVRGEEGEPLVPLPDPARPRALRELDHPVSGLEPVTFLLKSCCEELAEEMERRGTAASAVELRLALEDGTWQARRLAPSRPLGSARPLLDLCRLELDSRKLEAPVLALALSVVEEVPVQQDSGELFGRSFDLGRLAAAVDRLRVLLGSGRVVTPAPRLAHRREARIGWAPFEPDPVRARRVLPRRESAGCAGRTAYRHTHSRVAAARFASAIHPSLLNAPASAPASLEATCARLADAPARLATDPSRTNRAKAPAATPAPTGSGEASEMMRVERVLERPLPACVRLARSPDDPGWLEIPAAERGDAVARALPGRCEIVAQEGPLRVSGEWWDGGVDVDRDEYLLQDAGGGRIRACRDRRTKEWLVMGFED